MLTKISSPCRFSPSRFSIIAISKDILLWSNPADIRRGIPIEEDDVTSAWTSTKSGLLPSMLEIMIEPGESAGRSDKKMSDGFSTPTRPSGSISKTPISGVEPKRFFIALKIRYECPFSPSKYITVSTMCSSDFGPAIAPSLVIWPMSKAGMARFFTS